MSQIPPAIFMEPLMPEAGDMELEDLAVDLIREASLLEGRLRPKTRDSIAELVRAMNCYYSNFIEGHDTHPRDIERALQNDYSNDFKKRNLQVEAKAHIEVQRMIDADAGPSTVISVEFIEWLHREFCSRLPKDFLVIQHPRTNEQRQVIPGALRTGDVEVGVHVPPFANELSACIERFVSGYSGHFSKPQRIIAVAAAHHRLLWIHPFYDGNGRVTRLLSHAMLRAEKVGSNLWSVSRGLARQASTYKELLMKADRGHDSDTDGRGPLSLKALREFCTFFIKSCIDQVQYMDSLIEPHELLRRIELYARDETDAGRLLNGSFLLLREALLREEYERGAAATITGFGDRKARTILSDLVSKGLLVSDTPKGPVRLGFPIDAVERWFPKLYPV